MLPCPDVAAPPQRPIVGDIALESPHLHLGVAHHYQELAEAGADFIGLTILKPAKVKPINVLAVVGQRRYSYPQEKAQCTKTVQTGPAAQTVLYASWTIFRQHV